MLADLPPHRIELALVRPQIAPNTGNVARLCVATGTRLHLIRPMGFVLDDRRLRRSAMDYWPRLKLTVHGDLEAFRSAMSRRAVWLFEPSGERELWGADFADGDVLVFGSETTGLPEAWLAEAPRRVVRIPQVPGERCLNLATSCGIAVYEALSRVRRFGEKC
jgi:tRNA (cytidine/uridine-2'-O-)-methyltransferase